MKKTLITLGVLTTLFACDKITEPYEKVNEGAKSQQPIFPIHTDSTRKVLIEDMTGHTCIGCPEAAYIIDQIASTYPNQTVAIGVHTSDFFAAPQVGTGKYETDFRTDAGNQIFTDFPPPSLPRGMINRSDTVINNGSYTFSKANFTPAVEAFLNQKTKVLVQSISDFNVTSRELNIWSKIEVIDDLTGDYNLIVALTEDSIVDWQKSDGNHQIMAQEILSFIPTSMY